MIEGTSAAPKTVDQIRFKAESKKRVMVFRDSNHFMVYILRVVQMCAKRIYIDCTDTFKIGLNTGIQRVVRNVISRCDCLESVNEYQCIPVVVFLGELYTLDSSCKHNFVVTRTITRFVAWSRNILDKTFSTLSFKNVCDSKDVGEPYGLNEKAKKTYGHLLTRCRKLALFVAKLPLCVDRLMSKSKKVYADKGDILFLADSFWNTNTYNAIVKTKECGAKTIVLVYDIIPITHGDLVHDVNRDGFLDYFPMIMELAHGVISISKYSIGEIQNYCNENIKNLLQYDYFCLGSDYVESQCKFLDESHIIVKDLGKRPFLLMIGTIEPRKNHVLVIDTLERLWDGGYDISLCIIGRVGWKCDDIMEKITGSKYFNSKMFHYDSLDDQELSWCIQNSDSIVMASIVEGFGLPIIEAMYSGKTVFASDIPVFREVGGDYPTYFTLGERDSLINAILSQGKSTDVSTNNSKGWIKWDESVETLLSKVMRMANSH